jgi:perosamine synthetase
MFKPISISLSPNTEPDDVWMAFGLLFQPWKWVKSQNKKQGVGNSLEEKFADRLGVQHAYSFNSGRSAFLAILESLGLEKNDEVLLQAFTCNAVPNPVLWAGLTPVYVDCNEDDFNINVLDLEKKITPKSKVVIVQHTFGLAADMEKVMEICNKYNLILIEDCAHALGAKYKGKEVGTFGKAAFFSFSRDKVISCVYGGMAVTNNKVLGEKIKKFQEKVGFPSNDWVWQQLLHPVVLSWKILPIYSIGGKYMLVISQKLHILSKAVHGKEKKGIKPEYFPKRMPNALALLALHQLKKLERFNKHRKQTAKKYFATLQNTNFGLPAEFPERENIFLRFTVKHEKAHEIIKQAWKQNILLGDWYTTVLVPGGTDLEKFGYTQGSCPNAEKLSHSTLNLPTHINIKEKDFKKVVQFLKNAG